ncbi:MAG: DUF4345 family protein [Polyangiaceae bacterium]|jgi:hypothetical protein
MTPLEEKMPLAPPSSKPSAGRLAVAALIMLALAIALPGVVGLLAPGAVAGGAAAPAADTLNDARAVGGTRLAIAVLLALAAATSRWRRVGLTAGLVVFGCTLLGRLLSNLLDGAPGAMLKPELAEVVLLAVALVGLRSAPAGERR